MNNENKGENTGFLDTVWEKEKEWKDLVEQRIRNAEAELSTKTHELFDCNQKLEKLKQDFKYNLQLLRERDKELEGAEQREAMYQQQISENAGKLSQVKIEVATVREQLASRESLLAQVQQQLQEAHASHRLALQHAHAEHEKQMKNLRESNYAEKRSLELEVVRLQAVLEQEKHSLMEDTHLTLQRKESESRKMHEDLHTRLLSNELKYQLMEKELEHVRQSRAECQRALQAKEEQYRELELKWHDMELALRSEVALLEEDLRRVHEDRRHQESHITTHKAELERRVQNLTQSLREKEEALAKTRDKAKEETAGLQERCESLQKEIDQLQSDRRHLEWRLEEVQRDTTSHQQEEAELRRGLEQNISNLQSELATSHSRRQEEREAHAAELSDMRQQLRRAKEENTRLQGDLQAALSEESHYARRRAEDEVALQRKLENVELEQMNRVEAVMQKLSLARDEAQVRCSELARLLEQKEQFIVSLVHDRDVALNQLRRHGLAPPNESENGRAMETADQTKIRELEAQNVQLKNVIGQMREELQEQAQQQQESARNSAPKKHSVHPETSMDENISLLTAGNSQFRSVQELVNTVGKLRQEKIQLYAQLRKQEARLAHYQRQEEDFQREVKSQEACIEKLEYDLTSADRHFKTERETLKRTVAELEMQLEEARKESEEYYKGNIELAKLNEVMEARIVMLEKRDSELRKQHAHSNEHPSGVNFGAQELFIQQLQDEVEQLRNQLRQQKALIAAEEGDFDQGFSGDEDPELILMSNAPGNVHRSCLRREVAMRKKLRAAVKSLRQMAIEKQTLIELSSRLRADLRVVKREPSSSSTARPSRPLHRPLPSSSPERVAPSITAPPQTQQWREKVNKTESKLRELERLQYQISKKALQQIGDRMSQEERQPRSAQDEDHHRDMLLRPSAHSPRAAGRFGPPSESSLGLNSLQEVFHMLEETVPPSLNDDMLPERGPAGNLAIRGHPVMRPK